MFHAPAALTLLLGECKVGAFLGYGQRGVWANNRERDAFLDWFADHRCQHGDAAWQFCKSEGNRWMGCCIELSELIPDKGNFSVTGDEVDAASQVYWPAIGELLRILEQISSGEWQHSVSSKEAVDWRSA